MGDWKIDSSGNVFYLDLAKGLKVNSQSFKEDWKNTDNEHCYYCHLKTVPLFHVQRYCPRCKR